MQGADRSCNTKAQLRLEKGVGAALRQQHQEAAGITRDATAGAGPRTCRLLLDQDCLASRLCLSWQLLEQQQSRAGRDQEGEGLIPDPSGAVSRSNQLQDRGNKTVEVQY